jgi:hypothetical protein
LVEDLASETGKEISEDDESSDKDNESSDEEIYLSWNRTMAPSTKATTTPQKAAPSAAAASKKKGVGVLARLAPPDRPSRGCLGLLLGFLRIV